MIDIARLYERWQLEKVTLRHERSGPELYACCPFHGEQTPSFSTNMETGKWYCFTCHERGTDVESLIRKMEGMYTDSEVSLFLREYGTVTVSERVMRLRAQLAATRSRKEPDQPDTTQAKEGWDQYVRYENPYLLERGFDSAVVGAHSIGYNRQGREIVIPVIEHGICRFTYTRTTTNRKKAKYLYPDGVDRARYFWGLDKDKSYYDGSVLYITEGALDALWLRQLGYDAIAILGSHISQLQINKLKELNPAEIVLFFDNDDAGYEATRDAGKRLQAAGFTKVYYLRYRKGQDKFDPQKLNAKQIQRMVSRRRHVRHFYLKEIGQRPRVRRVLTKRNHTAPAT